MHRPHPRDNDFRQISVPSRSLFAEQPVCLPYTLERIHHDELSKLYAQTAIFIIHFPPTQKITLTAAGKHFFRGKSGVIDLNHQAPSARLVQNLIVDQVGEEEGRRSAADLRLNAAFR
jgi:hypothetical protein